jgi:hypothetical protein
LVLVLTVNDMSVRTPRLPPLVRFLFLLEREKLSRRRILHLFDCEC